MTLAQRGEGHLETKKWILTTPPQLVGEEFEDENEPTWMYKIGPQERTKFDEYYETRRAKNKNRKESRCMRTMKVEPRDVDSRRYRQYVGWSLVSTAECNDARYIRESNYVPSPLDKRRLNYYRPKVDSRHKGSESGAKGR